MQNVNISHDGPVTFIKLNRPEAMNSITDEMHHNLNAAFDDFSSNKNQLVAVISGEGDKAFCAGSDLNDGIDGEYPRGGYAGLINRFDLAKPVIAAVDGYALGGGFELALACDLIVASKRSTFGLPEPLVGAVALGGGLHRLPRQIGLKNAMAMILTSRKYSAEEGLRMGFVNEVVPHDELSGVVKKYCYDILKGAPMAIQASKMTVSKGLSEESLENAIAKQKSYHEFINWRNSNDAIEGIKAFSEKRKPNWTGS
mgnify:FL=1